MVERNDAQPRYHPAGREHGKTMASGGNSLWINTYSSSARAIYSPARACDLARSCVARGAGVAGVDQRWKNFLALVAHTRVVEGGA